MRPSTLIGTIKRLLETDVSVLILGEPGVGKTDILKLVARETDHDLLISHPAVEDPTDAKGMPFFQNGQAEFCPFGTLRRAIEATKPTIWFWDDFGQAPTAVQAAYMQLAWGKQLDHHNVSKHVKVIAASNRQKDRAGVNRLITPVGTRFMRLDLDVHFEDWQTWAIAAGIAPEVRGFINFRPTALHKFDAASDQGQPTPRTWEYVSRVLPAATDETFFDLVKGCVGDGPAAEFVAFAKVYRSLPDIDGILADPLKATVPQQPDVLYAVSTAVVEKVRASDAGQSAKRAAAALKYAGRMPKEFSVLTFRDLLKVNAGLLATAEGKDLLKMHRDALLAA